MVNERSYVLKMANRKNNNRLRTRSVILLCFLMAFFYTKNAHAQLTGRVLSKSDGKPVSYATIYLKNNNIGIHSNENGYFELDTKGIAHDSLFIQVIGYRPLHLSLDKAFSTSLFYLEETPINLQSVNIQRKKKVHAVWKGSVEQHKGFIFGQMGGSVLREVALYIPNDEQREGYLKEVSFYIVRFGKHKTPFRVRIYEPDDDTMPSRDLLTENVIAHGSRANHYCVVDISKYNIPFGKKGVFISMEWLNLSDKKYFYGVKYRNGSANQQFYGQQIGLTNEFEELQGRVKINNGSWKKMTAGYASPMFKAKIDFYDE